MQRTRTDRNEASKKPWPTPTQDGLWVTLDALFEAQAKRSPDTPAVVFEGKTLSYADLDSRANQLAHFLRSLGACSGTLVGICLERSLEMVVAVIGVLKAGGAYVPLDPRYPKDRLAFMLGNAKVPILLTQETLKTFLPADERGPNIVCLENVWTDISRQHTEKPPQCTTPESLAYVLYTSGSTGQPKGVAMGQRALVNLIQWQLSGEGPHANLARPAKTLQFSPLSFDVSFQEIFSTLVSGGTLVLVTDELRLDAIRLLQFLREHQIERLFLPFVALQGLAQLASARLDQATVEPPLLPTCLRDVITAGEQLQVTPDLVRFFSSLPNCTLHNHYGPTEAHVVTAYTLEGPREQWPALPPIGKPIASVEVLILDEAMRRVAPGDTGEIYLGGVCLAQGYLNNPDLTAERFVSPSSVELSSARLYRTGDLARVLPDGNIEYLGRIDSQVKVRGYRIELGEIEVALGTHPDVQQAVVLAREDTPGEKRLVAYLLMKSEVAERGLPVAGLRKHLLGRLPDYMVPSAFVMIDAFPRTPSGKIDRRGLPEPEQKRPDLEQAYVAPQEKLQKDLAELWCSLLKVDRVGIYDGFFDLGGDSLLALQFVARLQEETGFELPVVKVFEYPTIKALANYLKPSNSPAVRKTSKHRGREHKHRALSSVRSAVSHAQNALLRGDAIAIVGMAGRFPGAKNIAELWDILYRGAETTSFLTDADLDAGISEALLADPAYIKARGVMPDADKFDASFFGIHPLEAEVMDPQHRVFLEVAWETLEHAGYAPGQYPGLIGVYAGTQNNTYYTTNVLSRPDLVQRIGTFQAMVGNEKDYVATRVAHKLNLTGPALSIHTACSTSLVAVVQAVHALQGYECDMALAGGVSITSPQKAGYLYQEGGMLSNDGHCRPFDEQAQGTVFSDGVGIVLLKRLTDAIADGDTIHAVIRGAAMNNDGADKVSFTAPSVRGQAAVITMAQEAAAVEPETITYVEAHGTATPLGDPIEVAALTQAFRSRALDHSAVGTSYCALGSIKSNFGHLTAAAGVAGLIKVVLALQNRKIPPTVHFKRPNPKINFAASPFYVNSHLIDWPEGDTPRRAGVSSFGVGGTNAHVVLEEAPLNKPSSVSRPRQLLLLSAKTERALNTATTDLAQFLGAHPNTVLADVAFTLQTGRRSLPHRRWVECGDLDEARLTLTSMEPRHSRSGLVDGGSPPVVFMFPGQGSQYTGMGRDLYDHEAVFRDAVDRCAEILQEHLGRDLREVLYPAPGQSSEEAATDQLRNTFLTQPALFVVEYGLALLWQNWGVRPAAMMGHSVGEFVAACLSGVFSLEDALMLMATRGRMMRDMPPGTMLSVRMPAGQVADRIAGSGSCQVAHELGIASINSPSLCVVSGPVAAVSLLQAELESEGVICKPLHTSHAFHSPMMDPIVKPFAALLGTVRLSIPKVCVLSTVTGTRLSDEEATDPMYWARHLRSPVNFSGAVTQLWQEAAGPNIPLLLEVGPRSTLAMLARQHARDARRQIAVPSLGDSAHAEWSALLKAVGQLWMSDVHVDWDRFYAEETRHRVALPTYPFERTRYWIEPGVTTAPQTHRIGENTVTSVMEKSVSTISRKDRLLSQLRGILEEASGLNLSAFDESASFLEMGLDSLFLTQAALALQKTFGIKVTFRQLLEDTSTLGLLAERMDRELPREAIDSVGERAAAAATGVVSAVSTSSAVLSAPTSLTLSPAPTFGRTNSHLSSGSAALEQLIAQQLDLMAQQLAVLVGRGDAVTRTGVDVPIASSQGAPSAQPKPPVSAEPRAVSQAVSTEAPGAEDTPKATFGAGARISLKRDGLSPKQQRALDEFTIAYNTRTRASKRLTQENRAHLADPRVVSGFRPTLKELVYPIVVNRSLGSKLWDIDGNEYVDLTCGFGSNFFGNSAPWIKAALHTQLDQGIEIGPQNPLAGEAARLFCELTGMDRVAFCNTGSEAVLGAMRLARTVTGRHEIAIFTGSYHGIIDEVIVRGNKKLQSLPAAPGIPPAAVHNTLVLEYGTPESLEILRARAGELAAIMVEPVQSRRPDLQPQEFLHELRRITHECGTALIFDEVITGFRVHPAGAQGYFDIKADLATYGKVVGGGMPIGVIAGTKQFMDALDGGSWSFGDASFPEVGVTYFAGTFVRHPMALAAAKVVLEKLTQNGPSLQAELNATADRLAARLNAYFHEVEAPLKMKNFGSLMKLVYTEEQPYGELLYHYLRHRGIHIWDARPCFLTTAHSEADIAFIVHAFKESVAEMQEAGFLPTPESKPGLKVVESPKKAAEGATSVQAPKAFSSDQPPVPGARLGRDPNGNPGWFIADPVEPGRFVMVGGPTMAS